VVIIEDIGISCPPNSSFAARARIIWQNKDLKGKAKSSDEELQE
jgi:hypothetical protein